MWDKIKKKAIDTVFGTNPTVLGNIARGNPANLNFPKLGGLVSPLPARANIYKPEPAIPLPKEIKAPKPTIATKISTPIQAAKTLPKTEKPRIQITYPTASPTPDPRQSWKNMANMIIREGDARGYSGETLARQKALESGFGKSKFAKERFNYGGIGAYDANPNNAFSFNSPEEYLNYYFKLIKNRYPKAYAARSNPKKFIQGLKEGGYASDPNYIDKVMNTQIYDPYE